MSQPIIADFFQFLIELKTLSLKDWTTLLPLLIGFAAFMWRKLLSNFWHKLILFFKAPSMIESLQTTLCNHVSANTDVLVRIEKNLAMQEGRNRMLMSNLNVPMWEADSQGNWTWCNDELLSLLGTDLNSVLQDRWLNFIVSDEVERVAKAWYEAVEKTRTTHQIFNFITKDDDKARVRASSELIKSQSGEVVGILGALTVLK